MSKSSSIGQKISLIAIGNSYMGDDGIALALVDSIREQLSHDIDIHKWESKDALSVASELLEIHNPIVIVDCADMGINSGESRWFKQSECVLTQHENIISTHGFGFSEALALAETLGFNEDLYFFAVQPQHVDYAQNISLTLKNNLDNLSNALLLELNKLTVHAGANSFVG